MILVSILGDFHSSIFPLYYELKEKISRHIVVYDDSFSEIKKYKTTIDSLSRFNKKHSLDIVTEEFKLDEDSLQSIEGLIRRIKELDNTLNNVYINTTDGLANISIVLASKLLDKGVSLLAYDMYENSYNLTTKDSMKNITIKSSMGIEDHLLLKGLVVESQEDVSFAHRYQAQILDLFNTYSDELEYLKKDIFHQTTKNKNKYPRALQLVNHMGLDIIRDAKVITGGLFEYYVYLMVKDLGFDDIKVGMKVHKKLNNEITVENEFDILLMKDNHLHMIECKFTKNINLQELVYKYAALINLIDDDGRIMILTNKHDYNSNLYDKTKIGLNNHRRAFLNKIALRGSILRNKKLFLDDVEAIFL